MLLQSLIKFVQLLSLVSCDKIQNNVINQFVTVNHLSTNFCATLRAGAEIEEILIDAKLTKDVIADCFSGTAQELIAQLARKFDYFIFTLWR
jgi:hypothetical protein